MPARQDGGQAQFDHLLLPEDHLFQCCPGLAEERAGAFKVLDCLVFRRR